MKPMTGLIGWIQFKRQSEIRNTTQNKTDKRLVKSKRG